MSEVDLRSSLGELFKAGWGTRTPISWPNMKFEPKPEEAYVKFSIAGGETGQLEFGGENATVRDQGRVFVQVMVPLLSGDKKARELADAVKSIFAAQRQITTTEGRILLRRASSKPIGAVGTHDQTNVSIPYLYDTH